MNRVHLLAAAAVAPLAAAAAGPPSTPPTATGEVVIQLTTGGGISGPCCSSSDIPEVTVYADGRAVVIESTGGEVPEMAQATLSADDVHELLAMARAAGLFDAPDTGVICCDFAYTRVALSDGESSVEFDVTGLGFEDGELTAEQQAARAAVLELSERVHELVDEDADAVCYELRPLLPHEHRGS
jgi:hypothetical protein